ncbi:MAG: hypothetical protein R3F55_18980 [Alphaproteobacteria bacterium]
MRSRTSRLLGLVLLAGFLLWRIAGMPGLSGGEAGGLGSAGFIGQELENAAAAVQANHDTRTGPAIHHVDRAEADAAGRGDGVGVVRAGQQALPADTESMIGRATVRRGQ